MKAVRLSAKEVDLLNLLQPLVQNSFPRYALTFDGLLAKIDKANNKAKLLVSVADIKTMENDLVHHYPHRVISLNTEAAYARAAHQASLIMNHSTRFSDMAIMGVWLNQQQWLKGKSTILDLLNKWLTWWPKAEEWGYQTNTAVSFRESEESHGISIQESSDEFVKPRSTDRAGRPKKGFR